MITDGAAKDMISCRGKGVKGTNIYWSLVSFLAWSTLLTQGH